ncbi:MAG: sirohydrochlorin cobaltochelatase [Paludibacteraceae bacterium]|nr:sirohydrochlorin cobaltochelatase [Paludibacteraceae bacterium]
MKIKSLTAAVLASLALAMGFSSCSDDEEEASVTNNYSIYQKAVDNQVILGKKNNKAILLVAFGSTWQNAFKAFDNTVEAYKKQFPDCDVYMSFSSAICINRAAAGEHANDSGDDRAERRNYYAPNFWLHAFGSAKYEEITVQSLQVIPGEEYSRVINYIKDFANNSLGDLDDKYLSKVSLKLGTPLLNNTDDVDNVAKIINKLYSSEAKKAAVAFMGHGNPDSYDTYKANIRYTQLEEALQKYSKNYFVGTVDMPDNYKQDVYARMKSAGLESGKVILYPLMSIAGDHAHNDMAGEGDEYWDESDEESEDNSWNEYFSHKGYTTKCNIKGLLEIEDIRKVWIEHTKNPVELEDYYHSMYPED